MIIRKIIAYIAAFTTIGTFFSFADNYCANVMTIGNAETAEEYIEGTEGVLKYKKFSDHVEISGSDWWTTEGEIVIPEYFEGMPVTKIGEGAFSFRSRLISVSIPESVAIIRNSAFSYCSQLVSVNIPNGVTIVGNSAFSGCSSLESIAIPDGVTKIGGWTFSGCSALISIVIPDSVERLELSAFYRCTKLQSITIKNPECRIADFDSTICNGINDEEECYFTGIIYSYENSAAETYAEKYGYNFESLGESPTKEITYGDSNGDGEIRLNDAVLIMQTIGNPDIYGVNGFDNTHITEQGIINGDVYNTGDGLTNNDALTIQRYLVHLIIELPVKEQ